MSSMEQDPSHLTQGASPVVPVPFLQARVAGRRRVNPTSPRPTKRARWCDHEKCMKWVETNFSRHLNRHEKRHRVFYSWGCGKSVLKGQRANLHRHIRRVHTKEPLPCTLCDFSTYDNAEMTRHWDKAHEGIDRPRWPAPPGPPNIQGSSPAATDIPALGSSSSSSFSVLQLSPLLPVTSEYGSPPPPSSASSSASSLYSTPYSPAYSLAHQVNSFYSRVAEYSGSRVSEGASTYLPMPAISYEHAPSPSAPPPSPLIDHTPLSNFDAPVPQDSYQNVGDESHFGDTDVFLHASPYSPYLVDVDTVSTNPGFGLFSPTGFGAGGMLNRYPGSAVDGCIGPGPYSTGFSGSLSVGGLSHNNFPPVVPSPQSPLPYPMATDNTDRWFFPSNVGPTLPVVDSLAEPLWFSPSTSASTPSGSSLYGYGTSFGGRHPAVVGGTPCYHPSSSSLPDAGGPQPALPVSSSDSGFETLSGAGSSEHIYQDN